MQLDRACIAIRERSYLDVLDLSLHVIRRFAGPLSLAFLVGVVPLAVANWWLLAGLADSRLSDLPPPGYFAAAILLVVWEIPLATAPITLFLGQAMFTERPGARQLAGRLLAALPQLIWYQVIVRGLLVSLVLPWFFLFAVWPYLTEVIVLEQNALFRGRGSRMTTYRRSQNLHGGAVAELFARWLASLAIGGLLFAALFLSIYLVLGLLLSDWEWQFAASLVYCHLAWWLVVGYFAVVRFLSYLDLRIRREGWEVELLMRAERARMQRTLT